MYNPPTVRLWEVYKKREQCGIVSRLVILKGKKRSASLLVIVIINSVGSLTKQMEGMCSRFEELSFSLCSSTQMYMIIVYFVPKLSFSADLTPGKVEKAQRFVKEFPNKQKHTTPFKITINKKNTLFSSMIVIQLY